MAKPIFIATFPDEITYGNLEEIKEVLEDLLFDYHVVCFTGFTEKPLFQMFNDSNMTDASFKEIKNVVIRLMEKKLYE